MESALKVLARLLPLAFGHVLVGDRTVGIWQSCRVAFAMAARPNARSLSRDAPDLAGKAMRIGWTMRARLATLAERGEKRFSHLDCGKGRFQASEFTSFNLERALDGGA
jgi:hypothetical protein